MAAMLAESLRVENTHLLTSLAAPTPLRFEILINAMLPK